MYKVLLCWRYLRTRWIALASVISVTLGVATMIVVNAVMAGFSHEMQKRIHGILSDVVVESLSLNGFHDPERRMAEIRRVVGDQIECMTETVTIPAMLNFRYAGQWVTRPVTVVGIPEGKPLAAEFAQYLQHPENRKQPEFKLREGGYDTRDHQGGPEAQSREELGNTGWPWRRWKAERDRSWPADDDRLDPENGLAPPAANQDPQSAIGFTGPQSPAPQGPAPLPAEGPQPASPVAAAQGTEQPPNVPPGTEQPPVVTPDDPFRNRPSSVRRFDPAVEQQTGAVLGFALCTYRGQDKRDHFLVVPGDDVKLTMPTAGTPPRAIDDSFTVVDLYESKMNEYDSSFVFVPLRKLQEMRGMIDPVTKLGNVTSIQLKLKNPKDGTIVRDKLRAAFPPGIYGVFTWRDKQGPLLAAVQMETAILNVLLFMIIAVAGFGILAIFYMIVVEKTRDIGVLKSLGASGSGIMTIFLGYGLSLGSVGAGAGMVLGLLFVNYINEIADCLSYVTGQEVFDPTIYYFYEIPAIVNPWTVAWITLGAMFIAVMAGVLPARRAAGLHPVEALRYE